MLPDTFLTVGAVGASILSVAAAFAKILANRRLHVKSPNITIERDGTKIELSSPKPEDIRRILEALESTDKSRPDESNQAVLKTSKEQRNQ